MLLLGSMTFSQTSSVSGVIDVVQEDGLYSIRIPLSVRSYATPDLRDFRIWDAKGHQVPYFVQPTKVYIRTHISEFTEFPIISNTRTADSSSTYIFKNPYQTIESAVLLFANYQGSKTYRLEGSNDQKEWYGVVNSGQLTQLNDPKETSVYKTIQFPICRYPYLKIVFDDRHSLPVNLLNIGQGASQTIATVPQVMEEIPVKTIAYSEKDKKTIIQISFERPEVINQIRMAITVPELYSRTANLYTIKNREVKRGMESYKEQLGTLTIRSDGDLVFDIPQTVEQELYLEIDNKDNPKLEIKVLQFMQAPVYLVASLKSKESYKLTAGDQALGFPDYDIFDVTFTTESQLPIVQIGAVVYEQSEKTASKQISFWQQSWFMWCCIGIAALMISYFAFNLLKEFNKTSN